MGNASYLTYSVIVTLPGVSSTITWISSYAAMCGIVVTSLVSSYSLVSSNWAPLAAWNQVLTDRKPSRGLAAGLNITGSWLHISSCIGTCFGVGHMLSQILTCLFCVTVCADVFNLYFHPLSLTPRCAACTRWWLAYWELGRVLSLSIILCKEPHNSKKHGFIPFAFKNLFFFLV
jgi:hypothetical protein